MRTIKPFAEIGLDDIIRLLKPKADPEGRLKVVLFLVGVFLTPITLLGSLIGFMRAWDIYLKPHGIPPRLTGEHPIVIVSMALYGVFIWIFLFVVFYFYYNIAAYIFNDPYAGADMVFITAYLIISSIISASLLVFIGKWKNKQTRLTIEMGRHGTASWMKLEDLDKYKTDTGVYIGLNHAYEKQGHICTVGGTRAGKGTGLIIPNLLGKKDYDGSWVVIDPKGENLGITERFQNESGRKVIKLQPWGVGGNHFNPMDILNPDDPDMCDDAMMLAEMIIPINPNAEEQDFFKDRARAFICGLIMHIAIRPTLDADGNPERPNLSTIWALLRGTKKEMAVLFQLMSENPNDIVVKSGQEMESIKSMAEETFGSILSVAQQYTDFIKSPSLRESMNFTDFKITDITDGNTSLYIVIPADKLKSHYQWLRLVVVTIMRACVRYRNKRVTFILDEFSSLGYVSEFEVALSAYAGFNITLWPILQSLIQLQAMYGKNWETFMGNTAVKQFLTVRDYFTAEYVANLFGKTSVTTFDENEKPNSNERYLATPDEIMIGGGEGMYIKLDDNPPIHVPKMPFYEDPILSRRADKIQL